MTIKYFAFFYTILFHLARLKIFYTVFLEPICRVKSELGVYARTQSELGKNKETPIKKYNRKFEFRVDSCKMRCVEYLIIIILHT